jgi:hypothetical protein
MTTMSRSGQAVAAVASRLERVVRPRCCHGAEAEEVHHAAGSAQTGICAAACAGCDSGCPSERTPAPRGLCFPTVPKHANASEATFLNALCAPWVTAEQVGLRRGGRFAERAALGSDAFASLGLRVAAESRSCAVPARSAATTNWTTLRRRSALSVHTGADARPNVRAKRATTAGRQARAGENVPRTARPGLVACRWRSA